MQHRITELFTLFQIALGAKARELADAADESGALRNRDGTAGIQQIEGMRAFEHVIVSWMDVALLDMRTASFSYLSKRSKSRASSERSKA